MEFRLLRMEEGIGLFCACPMSKFAAAAMMSSCRCLAIPIHPKSKDREPLASLREKREACLPII